MPFTDCERTDIRRHCGYPAYGTGATGFQSWRFYQAYGLLEYRMQRLSGAEEAVVRTYLATLKRLERAVSDTSETLDTQEAAAWKRNPDELRERTQLFDNWRRRLCDFFGLPPGPGLQQSGITLVV